MIADSAISFPYRLDKGVRDILIRFIGIIVSDFIDIVLGDLAPNDPLHARLEARLSTRSCSLSK